MEMVGQRYKVSVDNLTLPTSPAAYDLLHFAPASNVPMALDRIIVTASQTTGTILRVVLTRRSTASTGGTVVVPALTSPADPAASTVITYNCVSSVGTPVGTPLDAQEWNELAPYEYNVRPGADLVVPGAFLGLYIPVAPGVGVAVSFTAEFVEMK